MTLINIDILIDDITKILHIITDIDYTRNYTKQQRKAPHVFAFEQFIVFENRNPSTF